MPALASDLTGRAGVRQWAAPEGPTVKPLLGLIALALAPAALRAADPRPNVVLVLVDDLGWTDVGCYGSDFYRTPHIDRLARDGVRFTQAYSACTVCSPTRASV